MLLSLIDITQNTFTLVRIIHGLAYCALILALIVAIAEYAVYITSPRRQLKNLRRYGILRDSNLADQYDSKYEKPEGSPANEPVRIKAMYIHPLKSCKFVEVQQARLMKAHFEYDRSFAFATEVEKGDTNTPALWRLISQRTRPLMSQVDVEMWLPHQDSDRQDPLVQAGGCVIARFPDPDPPTTLTRIKTALATWSLSKKPEIEFVIPMMPTPAMIEENKLQIRPFAIHWRTAHGLDMGKMPQIAAALPKLKKFLKVPNREALTLFRCTADTLTRTELNLAPLKHIGTPAVHGYTDSQPVHMLSLPSTQEVSKLLPEGSEPLNALRFRANLYLTGAPAYSEETWKRCRIVPKGRPMLPRASLAPTLSLVCRTPRCTMPNVDIRDGSWEYDKPKEGKKKGKPQPTTTLVDYRSVEDGCSFALGYLGMNAVPEDRDLIEAERQGVGIYISVGDEIEVVETGIHLHSSTKNDY